MDRTALKILDIASYTFLPAQTGGQKGIALFLKYFSKRVELHSVTTKDNQNVGAGYITIPLFSGSKLRYIDIRYFFRLKNYVRAHRITHVIVEHPYMGWLGVLLKKYCCTKLITHSHNIESYRWKGMKKWWWRILYSYEKWVHRSSDFNFFITDADRNFAVKHFSLNPQKCITVTYGTEIGNVPSENEVKESRDSIREKYQIVENEIILLFNGAFNYGPNLKALENLLNRINPLLPANLSLKYKILICGKFLPYEVGTSDLFPNVIFAGFVDDISLYLKGADIFLNPISEGGGIKTKLVEALAYNLTCVSFAQGAGGISPEITGKKLFITKDNDFNVFAENVAKACMSRKEVIPGFFYDRFFYPKIIDRTFSFLKQESLQ